MLVHAHAVLCTTFVMWSFDERQQRDGGVVCISILNISIISQCFFPSRRGRGSAPPSQRASSPAVPVQPSFRMYDTYRKIIHVTVRYVRFSRMNLQLELPFGSEYCCSYFRVWRQQLFISQSTLLHHIRSQNSTCAKNWDKRSYLVLCCTSEPYQVLPVQLL